MIYISIYDRIKDYRFIKPDNSIFIGFKAIFDETLFLRCEKPKPWKGTTDTISSRDEVDDQPIPSTSVLPPDNNMLLGGEDVLFSMEKQEVIPEEDIGSETALFPTTPREIEDPDSLEPEPEPAVTWPFPEPLPLLSEPFPEDPLPDRLFIGFARTLDSLAGASFGSVNGWGLYEPLEPPLSFLVLVKG